MAHYDQLRANSKAWEPSYLTPRTVVCPAAPVRGPHNIILIGGARTIVTSTPEYGWFPRAPELKPGTPWGVLTTGRWTHYSE